MDVMPASAANAMSLPRSPTSSPTSPFLSPENLNVKTELINHTSPPSPNKKSEEKSFDLMYKVRSSDNTSPAFTQELNTKTTSEISNSESELNSQVSPSISKINADTIHPKSPAKEEKLNFNGQGRNLNLISCEECGLICAGQSHYQVHIRSHTGERPFKCTVCGVAFTQKGNLRRHHKIHSDEKPFQCPVCSYRCRRRDALNGHMRIHSDVRPYQCMYCARSYKSRQSLKEHEIQCPYKQDPVLQASSPSRKQKQPEIPMMSLPYRQTSNLENRQTQPKSAYHAAMAVLAESFNPGMTALQRARQAAINPLVQQNASALAMSNFNFGVNSPALSNNNSSSGKRKATIPQKITQFQEKENYKSMMNAASYFFRDNNARNNQASIMSYVQSTLMNSMINKAAEAAVQPVQDEALDFSSKPHKTNSSLATDDYAIPRKKSRSENCSPTNANNGINTFYTEKLCGSAKRKRPKHMNERIVLSSSPPSAFVNAIKEYANTSLCGNTSQTMGPFAQYNDETKEKSMNDSNSVKSSTSPKTNDLVQRSENETTARTPSPTFLYNLKSGDASHSGLRVYSVPPGNENKDMPMENLPTSATELKTYFCTHCKCIFMDHIMYTIHAGCHGFRDPFECNVCGYKATDRYQFQCHIARGEHFASKDAQEDCKSPSSETYSDVNNTSNYTASMDTAQLSPKGYADFISQYGGSFKKQENEDVVSKHQNNHTDNIKQQGKLMINTLVQ